MAKPTQVIPRSSRVFRWVSLFIAMVLILGAVSAQPASAGTGFLQGALQPPTPNLGGTCINGFLIDSYHERLGPGWEITLTPQNGPSKTTTTDKNGAFAFTDLGAGTYMVELKMVEGWRPFTPTKFPVTLSGVGDGCAEVRFKLEALPCIEVIKQDANGEVNGDLVGIPGWGFLATQGNTSLEATTDGQGLAYFYNLTPGKWTVTEEEKFGWRPADGYGPVQEVDLYPPHTPGQCVVVRFVNEQVHDACVIVEKTDIAGNPVEGWRVAITRDDGTQAPARGETDEDGRVVFDGLALGKWTVNEETREWWRPLGETSVGVTLEKPGFCQVVEFVNEPLGCVDGYKINHLEQGLPGWKVNAINEETGQQFSTVTDENGYFYFNTLSLGTWIITEDLQPGWEPVTEPKFTIQVTEPFKCEPVRFKNRTEFACLDVFKRDQIDGVGLPGWKITLQPAYGGDPQFGITDGTGWVRFNELVPGTYVVKEDPVAGWTATTPEELTVTLEATGFCSDVTFCNIQTHMIEVKRPYPDNGGTCPMYYTVKRGDTLWAIGQRYDVPVSALVRVNHIKNPRLIFTGQRLCVPLGDP